MFPSCGRRVKAMRRFFLRLFLIYSLSSTRSWAGSACAGHGGVVRKDPASGGMICGDGTLDKPTSHNGKSKRAHTRTRVIKFKPHPDNGQILRPGQSPPPTNLKD